MFTRTPPQYLGYCLFQKRSYNSCPEYLGFKNSYIKFIQDLVILNTQEPNIIYRHSILTFLHIELVSIRMRANVLGLKKT